MAETDMSKTDEQTVARTDLATVRVGFIGYGHMAQAVALGLVHAGMPGGNIRACARTWDKLVATTASIGAIPCHDAREVVEASDVVFIAVKPQVVDTACAPIVDALVGKVVVSVAWGITYDDYEDILMSGTAHVSTVPNIPVCVDEGVWAVEDRDSLDPGQAALVQALLSATGLVVRVPAALLNAVGTVTGCGPAFAAMIVEAFGDAAVKHGVPRALSYKLVEQMLGGTSKMLLESGQHPAALKDAVCSPGGTTIRGVAKLEECGMRSAAIQAIDEILG